MLCKFKHVPKGVGTFQKRNVRDLETAKKTADEPAFGVVEKSVETVDNSLYRRIIEIIMLI